MNAEVIDRSLLGRIADRDRTALQQLFERHYPRINGFFRGIALDEHAADELTVDTFQTAWNIAGGFDDHLPVSMWLLELGCRGVLRLIGESRGPEDLGVGGRHDERPPVGLDGLSRADWVRALSYLPVPQRIALELTYRLGHSREEIAAVMGCSADNVQQDVSSARRDLCALLAVSPRANKAEALPPT